MQKKTYFSPYFQSKLRKVMQDKNIAENDQKQLMERIQEIKQTYVFGQIYEDQQLEINKNIQLQFCDKIRTFSRHNFTNFNCKIIVLHCVVSGLAKQNVSP